VSQDDHRQDLPTLSAPRSMSFRPPIRASERGHMDQVCSSRLGSEPTWMSAVGKGMDSVVETGSG